MALAGASSKATTASTSSKDPEVLITKARASLPAEIAQRCDEWLTQDLKEFLVWMNKTERRLTPQVASTAELRQEVDARWSEIIRRGEGAVSVILKSVDKKAVKAAFRAAVSPWFEGNPFILRAVEKPRGYPGDYLMMERFYIGQHECTGGFTGVLDRFLLDHYACVPNRKNRAKDVIRRHVARLASSGGPIRILSLGCGPSREWFEMGLELSAQEQARFANVSLTCLDQDQDVLQFCRERLTGHPLVHEAHFVESGLLGFSKSPEWIDKSGTFDLVYGFGIADYFHDEMLSSVITSGFSLLKVGGEVGIPHKSDAGFNYELADWICDWTFVKRTEQQYVELFKQAVSSLRSPFEFSMDRDPTQAIMFGTATRLR